MHLYRLLNDAHDSITIGSLLTRPSDHSNQKMGHGMYFGLDVFEALRFKATSHRHVYTHLVEVELQFEEKDLFDLRKDQNAIVKSAHNGKRLNERHIAFCADNGTVGIIWQSTGSDPWTEVVVLEAHIGAGFKIVNSAPV